MLLLYSCLLVLTTGVVFAQRPLPGQAPGRYGVGDSVRDSTPVRYKPTRIDPIFDLGHRPFSDTARKDATTYAFGSMGISSSVFQPFVLVSRLSPWRVGLFAGPNFAYCGTWENTFGPTRRDNTLYNGAGLNITGDIDYYFTPATRRLRFGLGTAFSYQNYYTRSIYRDYLYSRAAAHNFDQSQVTIRQRASEDLYLTAGPVLAFTIARSRRNPEATTFLELGLRGGLFRTEAATIAAYTPSTLSLPGIPSFVDGGGLIRSVNPSSRLYHPGVVGSVGVFFPLRNNWTIGIQGQGFITQLNYCIINGVSDTLYEFKRQYGGFSVGLTVRKSFVQRRLVPYNDRDADSDGVVDRCDACPQLPGPASRLGCPDSDGDGVIDPDDACPDDFGDPATCGCPDDDHDGVPNDCDCCPDEPGERADHGCPKSHQVEYNHVRLPARMRYCPLCPTDLPTVRRRPRATRRLTVRQTR